MLSVMLFVSLFFEWISLVASAFQQQRVWVIEMMGGECDGVAIIISVSVDLGCVLRRELFLCSVLFYAVSLR